MASISYFGQEGPYSQYEGSEIVAYAFSGYMYITGDSDREPLKAGGYQSEYHGGISAAMAVLASLNYRDLTGEGQYIDVSTVEAIASTFEGVSYYSMFEQRERPPPTAGYPAHPHQPSRSLPLHPSPLQGRLGPRPLFSLLPRGPGRANREPTPRRKRS